MACWETIHTHSEHITQPVGKACRSFGSWNNSFCVTISNLCLIKKKDALPVSKCVCNFDSSVISAAIPVNTCMFHMKINVFESELCICCSTFFLRYVTRLVKVITHEKKEVMRECDSALRAEESVSIASFDTIWNTCLWCPSLAFSVVALLRVEEH